MSDELATRSAQAWLMMIQADDPMPAFAALDFVQDLCDDRDEAHDALLIAMIVWLGNRRPEAGNVSSQRPGWHYKAGAVAGLLQSDQIDFAEGQLNGLRKQVLDVATEHARPADDVEREVLDVANAWHVWTADARLAVKLCRDLLAAVYAEGVPHDG